MIRVGWTSDGYPRWIMRGSEEIADEDFSIVDDSADPTMLWRSPAGDIVQRERVAIASDRTVIAADGIDTATLTGLPGPCAILVNRQPVVIDGASHPITAGAEGMVLVQLAGRWCGELVILVKSAAAIAAEVRTARDQRLTDCDWTQVPDAALSDAQRAAWAIYRSALRDLPAEQPGATIETVIWPTPPA